MTPDRLRPMLAGLLLILPSALAQFNRTTLLIDAPTADVLLPGSFAVSPIVTAPLTRSPMNASWDADVSVRYSPVERLELALTAYTSRDFVLGASYQLVRGGRRRVVRGVALEDTVVRTRRWLMDAEAERPSLAIGVHDIGLHGYVSPLGHGEQTWPDWKYEYRPAENLSAFAVATVPVLDFARLHAGIGRGRYVGYCHGRLINTDIILSGHHQWALGLFGGVEVSLGPYAALAAEFTGRDAGAAFKVSIGPVETSLAWTKAEGLIFPQQNEAMFGRLACALSYRIDRPFRRWAPAEPPPISPYGWHKPMPQQKAPARS